MKMSYFPGCSLKGTAKEYDISTRAVCNALGIELVELEDWNCCGATVIPSIDRTISLALAARNFAIAEKDGFNIITPCSACYSRFSIANETLLNNLKLMEKVNKALESAGLQYKGHITIRHLVDFIVNVFGLEKISEKITKSLKNLKISPYYGCLMTRPRTKVSFDSPENPQALDKLIITLGGVNFPSIHKASCCGGAIMVTKEEAALKLTKEILVSIKEIGADCITTACPFCQMNLDAKQAAVESKYNIKINLPVFYFTQLIGLAIGLNPKDLGLDKNIVAPEKILTSI